MPQSCQLGCAPKLNDLFSLGSESEGDPGHFRPPCRGGDGAREGLLRTALPALSSLGRPQVARLSIRSAAGRGFRSRLEAADLVIDRHFAIASASARAAPVRDRRDRPDTGLPSSSAFAGGSAIQCLPATHNRGR
jgi:hypothetical protein